MNGLTNRGPCTMHFDRFVDEMSTAFEAFQFKAYRTLPQRFFTERLYSVGNYVVFSFSEKKTRTLHQTEGRKRMMFSLRLFSFALTLDCYSKQSLPCPSEGTVFAATRIPRQEAIIEDGRY